MTSTSASSLETDLSPSPPFWLVDLHSKLWGKRDLFDEIFRTATLTLSNSSNNFTLTIRSAILTPMCRKMLSPSRLVSCAPRALPLLPISTKHPIMTVASPPNLISIQHVTSPRPKPPRSLILPSTLMPWSLTSIILRKMPFTSPRKRQQFFPSPSGTWT